MARTNLGLLAVLLLAAGCASTPPLPEGEVPTDFLFTYSREAPPGGDLPPGVRIEVDCAGAVQWTVRHGAEGTGPSSSGQDRLEPPALAAFYEAVRAADLHRREAFLETAGGPGVRETFRVIGRNRPAETVVIDTDVPDLARLRTAVFALVGDDRAFEAPVVERRLVVLDVRTGVFYKGGSPKARAIPPESRREFPDPWAALNAGGIPSEEFPPLEQWD